LRKLKISIEKHHSVGVAVVGHYDCVGNPVPKDEQISHIKDAVNFLRHQYRRLEIIGLWVDKSWEVQEILKIKKNE